MISIPPLTIRIYKCCTAAHLIPEEWIYLYEMSKPKCRHAIEEAVAPIHWNINRMGGDVL